MPSRKRRVAVAEPEKKEEPRAPVTQVVEVVEDQEAEKPKELDIQETGKTEAEEVQTKHMVDELYEENRGPAVMPEISMHKNKPRKSLVVWAIVTILVALVTGGILFAVNRGGSGGGLFAAPTPTPTPAPTSAPTPTPPDVDKSTISVNVLNGGGTPGAAGKMKTFLEEAGYTVEGTGNTEEYTYETTEIHVKPSLSDILQVLEMDLKDTYALGTVSADLSDDESFDVQIIVGKE